MGERKESVDTDPRKRVLFSAEGTAAGLFQDGLPEDES